MTDKIISMEVVGSGMVTAAGFNAPATCAAIRAGISGIRQDNIWDWTCGDYMGVGRPHTPQWWEGPDMLAELAAPAIMECLYALPQKTDLQQVPILVLLSSKNRPHREPDLDYIVSEQLEQRLPFKPSSDLKLLNYGRSGIIPALQECSHIFAERLATHVVVVGVDTFLRQRVVDEYASQRRVLTSNNSNGFIPGEAACAVLIAPPSQRGDTNLRIIGWGQGREKGTIESDTPLTGDGLTHALRDALKRAGLVMSETDYWLTDQNAEHYKAKECTIAQIRLERRDEPALVRYQIWHPIEYLGEIGSAIAPCLLGLSLAAAKGKYAPGPLALLHVGEDNGERAALVLQWLNRI
jgi:3-oxoacyl-[acyl-carrier-protein] synthase-1